MDAMPAQSLRIDSPSPEVAHADAEKYFAWLWPAFELSRFEYTLEEFDGQLVDGTVCLVRVWNADEPQALAAVKAQETVDGNELLVMAIVGYDVDDWLDPLNQSLEKLAIEIGCSHICMKGRPGWQKLVKPLGYKLNQVTMRKDLRGQANGKFRNQ